MRRAVLFLLGAGFLNSALGQSLPAPSTWQNQRGSVLTILAIDPAGAVKGTFLNNAAGFQCRGIPVDVSGRLQGEKIFMIATFAACNSFVVWRGTRKDDAITTEWDLRHADAATGEIVSQHGDDIFGKTK